MAISDDLAYELAYLSANGLDLEWSDMVCPDCGSKLTVVAVNDNRVPDFEVVICPVCEAQVKRIRADIGFRIAEIKTSAP
ncbi:MAG TPA: hypothetical protein PLE01_00435 [Syntrophothermus lipocalidus]|nr:hypothetical protein [Syntrophothermus lipocalidus]